MVDGSQRLAVKRRHQGGADRVSGGRTATAFCHRNNQATQPANLFPLFFLLLDFDEDELGVSAAAAATIREL